MYKRQAYEYGNQKQAYEAGAVPKKKRERSFYDLSLVVIIIVLTVFGLEMCIRDSMGIGLRAVKGDLKAAILKEYLQSI